MTINPDNISNLRTVNQQLTFSKFKTGKEIVDWIGPMQAQDYNMSKWALGIRLQNSTEAEINREIDSGAIIRTHLMRPTWHLVSSDDLHWILELTAPHLKTRSASRDKQLGLTDAIIRKCNKIIEKELRDSNHCTREELLSELVKNKIDTDNNRASHIFMRAEIEGIICSGRHKKNKQTYAILDEWVMRVKKFNREEALKELATRYFTSRGPALIQDFIWWSGLSLKNAKLALEFNKDQLLSETIGGQTYWFADSEFKSESVSDEILLLPAFDEYIICYRDRSAFLSGVDNKKTISNNGIFYPSLLKNGQIIGTWKRNITGQRLLMTINQFKPDKDDHPEFLLKCLNRYSKFIDRKIELNG